MANKLHLQILGCEACETEKRGLREVVLLSESQVSVNGEKVEGIFTEVIEDKGDYACT